MTGRIGYYVHHHGDGHRRRAIAIARQAPDDFVLIGTGLAGKTEGLPCLDLPDDRPIASEAFDGVDDAVDRPLSLHYAPVAHEGVRRRVALLSDWIDRERPSLLVVDVSVEIAMLARLAATPTLYVRLSGCRDDMAHLEAFRGAAAVLAPFHRDLDEPSVIPWVRDKTMFCPGLTLQREAVEVNRDVVLVVFGKGGRPGDAEALSKIAQATPDVSWRVIGPVDGSDRELPANLTVLGWIDHADEEIARAGIVVGAAGDGLVGSALAANRPLICLAEPRPFGEQISKARRLDALGAAIALEAWPDASQWPLLLADARKLRPEARRRLHDPDGVAKAAAFLRDRASNLSTFSSDPIGTTS